MKWTVETLNAVVDAELEALPVDMLARFHYISQLIEEFGQRAPRQAPAWAFVGNAHEGKGWNFSCLLRDGCWQARRRGPSFHQEITKDAKP